MAAGEGFLVDETREKALAAGMSGLSGLSSPLSCHSALTAADGAFRGSVRVGGRVLGVEWERRSGCGLSFPAVIDVRIRAGR